MKATDKISLRLRRKELGLTLEEVGNIVGVGKSTVRKWETGEIENMKRDKIVLLAKALQVKPSFIMGWDDQSKTENIGQPYNPTKRIPILGRISAGIPLYAEEHIEGYTYTDLNGDENEYFALRVHGDSMNALRICDNDLVIVRKQSDAENGQIVIAMVNGDEATIKRFYQNGNSVTLMPQSTNPAHVPQVYDITKIQIKIIGLVVESKITFLE